LNSQHLIYTCQLREFCNFNFISTRKDDQYLDWRVGFIRVFPFL
jgi:hypothetical protein